MDLANTIASPSPELKSSSLPKKQNNSPSRTKQPFKRDWAQQHGIQAEKKVLQYYLGQNYRLIQQRHSTPFAEIDLLLEAPDGYLVMVEVKTLSSEDFMSYRISSRQKKQQEKALLFLTERFKKDVAIHWAFVMDSGKIVVIDDICV